MRILLIHDTRSVSLLSAVILYRVLTRLGNTVQPFFGSETTRHARDFWTTTVDGLNLDNSDQIYLCSITFDDSHPDRCLTTLKRLGQSVQNGIVVLTHRWPDGYLDAGVEVIIPPFDLVERFAKELTPVERELLRYSLIISRQAEPEFVSSDDFYFCEYLGTTIWKDFEAYWWKLANDLDLTMLQLRRDYALAGREDYRELSVLGKVTSRDDGWIQFELAKSSYGHCEKTVEELMRLHDVPEDAIGIGVLDIEDLDDPRVYLHRPWSSKLLPSIGWLLEQFSAKFNLPPADSWWGPQNAKSILLSRARLTRRDLPALMPHLHSFAAAAFSAKYGERSPNAALTRVLHDSATRALRKLDLKGGYVTSLRFDPSRTRIRIDQGNRSGKERATVVLRLLAENADAAAFLYAGNGYNLGKLERLLEGILLGLGSYQSAWLGSLRVPERLRIDVHMPVGIGAALGDRLRTIPEVEPLSLARAIELGLLTHQSSIHSILSAGRVTRDINLILYRESETIGPSVQFSWLVGALASEVAASLGREIQVLDLFAGSGLVAREILSKQRGARVYCVDAAITAEQAGSKSLSGVTWLRTHAHRVCGGPDALLDMEFDLISMDPPHAAVFDLLYRAVPPNRTFIDQVAERAPWLVVYQGHVSQFGRARSLEQTLAVHYRCTALWTMGAETIMIAGPAGIKNEDTGLSRTFGEIMAGIEHRLQVQCERYAWVVNWALGGAGEA